MARNEYTCDQYCEATCQQMFQLLNPQKQHLQVVVISCHCWVFNIVFVNSPSWEHNALKPLMHEDDNLQGICGYVHNTLF